ncbi:MAG TPA: TIGR02266 family protein [Bdellovibrionota bacterium]|nr:TIGR02266 family protein [Bdellovibrionota bacterium]
MPSPKERRRAERIQRRFGFKFEAEGKTISGTILNLSEVGMLIQADRVFQPGSRITIPLQIAPGQTFSLQGNVVWSRPPKKPLGRVREPGTMGIDLGATPSKYTQSVAQLREYLTQSAPRGRDNRFDVFHRVQFKSGAEFLTEYTENLSRGGMYLATDRDLKVGTVIQIQMEFPGTDEPLEIKGRVAYRMSAAAAKATGRSQGLGIQFVNLSETATNVLHQYIRRLEIHRLTEQRRQTDVLPSHGSLADFLVPELLLYFHRNQSMGVLRLKRRNIGKSIFFQKGQPVYVDSELQSESLGQYLAAQGVLQLENMTKWLPALERGDFELCRFLLGHHMIEQARLLQLMVSHQEDKLINVFSWFEGEFSFSAQPGPPPSILPLQTFRIIFDGISRWFDAAMIGAWMGLSEDSALIRKEMPSAQTTLPPLAYAVLHELWVPMTIRRLAEELHAPISELVPIAFGLIVCGWVNLEFSSEKPAERAPIQKIASPQAKATADADALAKEITVDFDRLQTFDFYHVLGIERSASAEQIETSYRALAEKYSHERTKQIQDPASRGKVSQILAWIQVARNTLSDPSMRAHYDHKSDLEASRTSSIPSMKAQEAISTALEAIDRGDASKGLAILRAGADQHRDHPTLSAYAGWAMFQTDRKKHAAAAAKSLEEGIARDPSDPYLFYFRGMIYAAESNWIKAEACFSKAIRLRPQFPKAVVAHESTRTKRIERERISKTFGLLDT